MGHLNAETLAKLLKNPKDEAELYAHLAGGCDACEAFLATAPEPLLDGTTDAALLSLAPARQAAPDPREEQTFRRIRAPKEAPSRRWLVALAAMLLAVVAAMFLLRPRDEGGLKGAPRHTVELQAVVKGSTGALTRLETGQSVAPDGTLVFRYHASDATVAKLVVVRNGQREELGSVQLESGTHDLTRDGSLLGLSLEGERGTLLIRLETVESAAQLELKVD